MESSCANRYGFWIVTFSIVLRVDAQQSSTGVPHCVSADDIHRGYLIPKGAIIFANLWSVPSSERVFSCSTRLATGRYFMIPKATRIRWRLTQAGISRTQ